MLLFHPLHLLKKLHNQVERKFKCHVPNYVNKSNINWNIGYQKQAILQLF